MEVWGNGEVQDFYRYVYPPRGRESQADMVGETGQLNLSTTLPRSIIDQAEKVKGLQYIDIDNGDSTAGSSASSRAWVKIGSALTSLQDILNKQDGKTTTRIIINELGSADWENPSSHVCSILTSTCWANRLGDSPILTRSEIACKGSQCRRYDHPTSIFYQESR